MEHRHLTPEEIDLLVDITTGYAVAGSAHTEVGDCAQCQARLADAMAVVSLLDAVPRLAPSHAFGNRVMSQVPVFVPWWVSLRDSVKPWIPVSQPARIALGVLATAAASVVSVLFLWVMTQTDALTLASGAAGNRVQELFGQGLQALAAAIFGEGALGMIQQRGPAGVAVALTAVVVVGSVAVLALRRVATAASRRRSAAVVSRG